MCETEKSFYLGERGKEGYGRHSVDNVLYFQQRYTNHNVYLARNINRRQNVDI